MRISDWSSDVCSSDLFGGDVAGRDGVHGNAFGRILLRHRLGEAEYAGLGGRIVGLAELALLSVDRGDRDDAAVAARAHALDHVARHVEQPVEEIGMATWRESVCQYGENTGVGGS